MALFGSKKKETVAKAEKAVVKKPAAKKAVKAEKVVEKTVAVSAPNAGTSSVASSIIRPRITEKSGLLSQMGVYTFEVSRNANKASIAAAVKTLYKVEPIKVAVMNNPTRNVFVRGRKGTVSGVRKALVTLKKGDKIEFV
ncbi:MAG: ribosomal subunit protein large subunit ribosomal protein [Candidatus Parcubacteria bacterium]|jgi:large subunit ribosomal protein L23